MNPESEPTNRKEYLAFDLEPMYELSEADYQQIIGQLAGLLAATVEQLRDVGQAERAMALAEQARGILLDYDDDVADAVRSACRDIDEDSGLRRAREDCPW